MLLIAITALMYPVSAFPMAPCHIFMTALPDTVAEKDLTRVPLGSLDHHGLPFKDLEKGPGRRYPWLHFCPHQAPGAGLCKWARSCGLAAGRHQKRPITLLPFRSKHLPVFKQLQAIISCHHSGTSPLWFQNHSDCFI